jgi:hypothetical protein
MSLNFPISLVGKKASSGGDGPFATSLYDSGDNLLVSIETDIPDIWNDNNTPYNATRLEIGTSCTTIGIQAFTNSTGLTGSLTIPDSVTTIGSQAFAYCTGFNGSLTIGNSVTSIGSYAFSGCTGFTGLLTIGNSVTSIGSYAFQDAEGSPRVIPDSVTSIGNYAFAYNFSSSKDYIGCPASSFTGSNAFYGCTALNTLYAKDAVANGYTLGAQTFQGKSLTIANWDNYPNIP